MKSSGQRMKGFHALLVFLLMPAPSHPGDAPDLLLRDGIFYTVTDRGTVEGSMVVDEGRIVFIGPTSEAEQLVGDETRIVELGGRAVTPGLIDAHAHLIGLGRSLEIVDLVGTTSYEQVVEIVASAAAELPAGEWIMGRGWDQNDWLVRSFPGHGPLSRAVPDRPVWLDRIDGHAALLNEEAMRVLGIDSMVEDPAGGRYVRDRDGEPTGVLIDGAIEAVAGGMPAAPISQVRRWIEKGALHGTARGLTTVTDMGVNDREYRAYSELRESGNLPVRVAVFLGDEKEMVGRWLERGPELDEEGRLTVTGIKLYADGALGSRGAALIEEYADDPGNLGLLRASVDHMTEVCGRALEAGFQVGIHAIGDRGNLLALDAIENCFGGSRPEARFRIEHAQVMRVQDIQRMARLGVIASVQPTHATSDMPWAGERVGARRLQGAYAWRRMIDAGAVLALGSDAPVERVNPLLGLYAAVSRQDAEGRPVGGWGADQRLTRIEALRGFTIDAAYSLFLDEKVGSLATGKQADAVVFARDPMVVPVAEIPAVEVDLTLLEGEIVFAREEGGR